MSGPRCKRACEGAHRLVIAIPVQADGRDPTFRLPCHGERVDEVLVKRCEQVCQEDSDRLDPGGTFALVSNVDAASLRGLNQTFLA